LITYFILPLRENIFYCITLKITQSSFRLVEEEEDGRGDGDGKRKVKLTQKLGMQA
jgi:hypothetical protein